MPLWLWVPLTGKRGCSKVLYALEQLLPWAGAGVLLSRAFHSTILLGSDQFFWCKQFKHETLISFTKKCVHEMFIHSSIDDSSVAHWGIGVTSSTFQDFGQKTCSWLSGDQVPALVCYKRKEFPFQPGIFGHHHQGKGLLFWSFLVFPCNWKPDILEKVLACIRARQLIFLHLHIVGGMFKVYKVNNPVKNSPV